MREWGLYIGWVIVDLMCEREGLWVMVDLMPERGLWVMVDLMCERGLWVMCDGGFDVWKRIMGDGGLDAWKRIMGDGWRWPWVADCDHTVSCELCCRCAISGMVAAVRDGTYSDNNDNNNNSIRFKRHNSRFLQSPDCTANCLQHARSSGRCSCVQITCNTWSAFHIHRAPHGLLVKRVGSPPIWNFRGYFHPHFQILESDFISPRGSPQLESNIFIACVCHMNKRQRMVPRISPSVTQCERPATARPQTRSMES